MGLKFEVDVVVDHPLSGLHILLSFYEHDAAAVLLQPHALVARIESQ